MEQSDSNEYDIEEYSDDSDNEECSEDSDNLEIFNNELHEEEKEHEDSLLDRIVQLFAWAFLFFAVIKIIGWIF